MKPLAKGFAFFILVLAAALFVQVPKAYAKVFSKELAVIPKDEVVDEDLFITGETVRVDGVVNGDLYAAGGNVIVSGEVNGDVIAVGGMIDISGKIADDLILAGGNINIDEVSVSGSSRVAGGNVNLGKDAKLAGSLVFGAGNLTTFADIGKSMVGGAGSLAIDGKVAQSAEVGTGTLTLGPNAAIGQDLVYSTEKDFTQDVGAIVRGETKKIEPIVKDKVREARKESRFSLFSFLASLAMGFAFIAIFKKHLVKISQKFIERPVAAFLIGAASPFVVFPLLFMLFVTIVGIPLSLVLLFLFVIDIYVAKIFVAHEVGKRILEKLGKKDASPYLSFSLGLLILYVIFSVRIVGTLTWIAATSLGLGALILYKKSLLAKPRK